MFWRKKSAFATTIETDLYALAAELGAEKRFSPRIGYPPSVLAGLPSVAFGSQTLRAHDLSVGGVSVFDPAEVFGAAVGLEHRLILRWPNDVAEVTARLVGRVDQRRNFQFVDLSIQHGERIRGLIAPGVRGLNLAQSTAGSGSRVDTAEIWTSTGGDSVAVELGPDRMASIYLSGRTIIVPFSGAPRDEFERPLSADGVNEVILFVANAPRRSAALERVLERLEHSAGDLKS